MNSDFGSVVSSFENIEVDAPAYFNVVGLTESEAVVITKSYKKYTTHYIQ